MNTPFDRDDSPEQRLDEALGELAREVEPPAEVWPAVRARLSPRAAPRTTRGSAMALAAAAVLLVAASVAVVRTPSVQPVLAPVANLDSFGNMPLLAELTAELEARRDVLSPETIAIVEQNLRLINGAIAQTAKALAEDPGNVQLELMLTQVTRQRDEFVRETRSMVSDL